jgi:hypothetical protein
LIDSESALKLPCASKIRIGPRSAEAEQQQVAQVGREPGDGGIGQHVAQPLQGRVVELDVAGDIALERAREIFRGVAGLAAGLLVGPGDQVGDDADDRGHHQVGDRHDRPAREPHPGGRRGLACRLRGGGRIAGAFAGLGAVEADQWPLLGPPPEAGVVFGDAQRGGLADHIADLIGQRLRLCGPVLPVFGVVEERGQRHRSIHPAGKRGSCAGTGRRADRTG